MITKSLLGASAAAILLSAGLASAATVSFNQVGRINNAQNIQPAVNAFFAFEALMGGTRIMENFDGAATPGGTAEQSTTGTDAINRTSENTFDEGGPNTFAGLGGRGTGNTRTNDGNYIQIRDGNNGGRVNVMYRAEQAGITAAAGIGGDGNFLDSNDTKGFVWTLTNIWDGLFQGVQAFITDPNDAGGNLQVTATTTGGSTVNLFNNSVAGITNKNGNIGDGTIWHFTADLRGLDWERLTVRFDIGMNNDGFGISNLSAHVIPLPAPALLLLSGLGALGGLSLARRRRGGAAA